MRYLLILVIFLYVTFPSTSQSWGNLVNFPLGDQSEGEITSLASLPDGSLIVSGTFSGSVTIGTETLTTSSGEEGFLIKVNEQGEIMWLHRLQSSGSVTIEAVVGENTNIHLFVTGTIGVNTFSEISFPENSSGTYLKVDQNGNLLKHTHINTKIDSFKALKLTGDRLAMLFEVNNSFQFDGTQIDINNQSQVVMSLDTTGSYRWHRSLPYGSMLLKDVAIDENRNVLSLGYLFGPETIYDSLYTDLGGNSTGDLFVIEYSETGAVNWVRKYGSQYTEMAYRAVPSGSNSWYVTGYTSYYNLFGISSVNMGGSAFIVELDRQGEPIYAYGYSDMLDMSNKNMMTPSASGGAFVIGHFNHSAKINSPLNDNFFPVEGQDAHLYSLNDGQYSWSGIWGLQAGGDSLQRFDVVAADINDNPLVGGYYATEMKYGLQNRTDGPALFVLSTVDNVRPSIAIIPSQWNAEEGQEFNRTINFRDSDADTLYFNLTDLPAGLQIDTVSAFELRIHGIPEQGTEGEYAIDLSVTDSLYEVSNSYTLLIEGEQTDFTPPVLVNSSHESGIFTGPDQVVTLTFNEPLDPDNIIVNINRAGEYYLSNNNTELTIPFTGIVDGETYSGLYYVRDSAGNITGADMLFRAEFITTGTSAALESEEKITKIYTLQGQSLNTTEIKKLRPGCYIIRGSKGKAIFTRKICK